MVHDVKTAVIKGNFFLNFTVKKFRKSLFKTIFAIYSWFLYITLQKWN